MDAKRGKKFGEEEPCCNRFEGGANKKQRVKWVGDTGEQGGKKSASAK